MIRTGLLSLFIVFTCSVFAQEFYPDLSYDATIIAKAGFTNFKISYGRPLQRGRELFGSFIPYGQRWRTGANGTTQISFDTPVLLGDTRVEAGNYALVTIPGPADWEIILHQDTTMFTDRKDYLIADEVAHIRVRPVNAASPQEAFTIFTDVIKDDLKITIAWGLTRASFILHTGANEFALNTLRSRIKNETLKTADELAAGANFLAFNYSHLGDHAKDTAVLLIDKAIALEPHGGYYRTKRNIFWLSKDLSGIRKSTAEWINYYQNTKLEGYQEDIQQLKDELQRFEKALSK